jgi:hypothetical protein
MENRKRFWDSFKNFAIIFSFAVNFITVVVLLVLAMPGLGAAFAFKTNTVEPLLANLDAAFVGLGEAAIDTTIAIDEPVAIQFNLPLAQPLPVNFDLLIVQNTDVYLTENVPLSNLPATFNLPGGGGVINGTVSLALPAGMRLPIQLNMTVPVSTTIPVRMDVPVDQTVPIRMTVPVHIKLGESGLDPAVEDLRAVFRPVNELVQSLPDGIEFGGGD